MQGVEIFFKYLFGPSVKGYVCLAQLTATKTDWKETFFKWPEQLDDMVDYVGKNVATHNLYVCPQILNKKIRRKEHVIACPTAWADLDGCSAEECIVPPTIAIESSEGRYQAYWCFEDPIAPEEAEAVSRRIAYYHAFQGADKSGWDLTQLLRIPHTYNFNHGRSDEMVKVLSISRNKYRVEDFSKYPAIVKEVSLELPMPEHLEEVTGDDILDKYAAILPPQVDFLFHNVPDGDSWSESLWRLQLTLFEGGLSPEEVYVVARDSQCNKYKRDNRPTEQLWKEVCRSRVKHAEVAKLNAPQGTSQSGLLTQREKEHLASLVGKAPDFVSDYIAWAKTLGDAAPQYHQAGAFVILSSLLGGSVRLPTSFGTMKPNLWFMILADTTLTRKSTAMDIAMDLIEEVDSGAILATDGSIEGLMGSLSTRPGQPSVFLRDEFSGLLESITKKDYYAGMAETLTKLYDGKMQKRVLKKEVIEVKDPVLILFAGGIRSKVCSLLTVENISSGFVPRFVFITAESDVSKVQPLGPPTAPNTTGRIDMLAHMREMYLHYRLEPKLITVDGRLQYNAPPHWNAQLTPEAWRRYNVLEADMMKAGLATDQPEIMTPTYDRLCKSALKSAVLLAASGQRPEIGEEVIVTLDHLLHAIGLAEGWREHANMIIKDVGISQNEREFQRILAAVIRKPGISRSQLMQNHHLTARVADQIFSTLEQRGLITRHKSPGQRTERIFPVNAPRAPTTVRFSEHEAVQ
jgi:hypothetical protein